MARLPSGQVTFCFTDIEGSTQLFAKLGPRFLDLLETHRTIVRNAFAPHGAAEVRSEGDGFFFAFDDSTGAARASIEAQRAMAAHDWPDDAQIKIRIGFHSGQAEPKDGDYLAFCVHEAARISAAAHGGQILTSEETAQTIERSEAGLAFVDLGEHHLKDLPPMRLAQVAHPELPTKFPPLRSAAATRGYVPAPTTELVGREQDIADLRALASKTRLLTITGAGGVGKTRIAVELARAHLGMHADGVWFIDLAPVTDPGYVDDVVLQALGVSRDTSLGPRAQLIAHLSSRNVLLVIDNCEHLIDACSSLIDEILRACPSVTIVATSREPIGIDGEVTRALRSLDTSESHALFVRRASVINDALELDDDARAAIDRIVERLDGIPLAIELAAARSRILTPQQIAERLDDRFQLLTGGSRTALARQRTLEATVEWSYGLLEDDERTLLERASVFIGSFDLDAIESVCGAGSLDTLDRLVAKSMVTSTFAEGGVRYRMLETIRHFARDKLVASGDAAEYRDRHARYFRTLVCSISDGFMDERENEAAATIAAAYPNVRTALEWLIDHGPEDGLELAGHLWLFWAVTGRPVEALEWVERFLDAAPDADPDVLARGHAAACHLNALRAGDPTEDARLHGEAAVARMRERDGAPRWYEAWALMQLVDVDRYGEAEGIEVKRRAAIDVCRDVGNGFVLANALRSLAWDLGDQLRPEEALATLREAVEVARECGSRSAMGAVLGTLSEFESSSGVGDPVAHAREAVALVFDAPNVYFRISALLNLGDCLDRLGLEGAEDAYERCLAIAEEHGADWEAAASAIHLGWIAAERSSLDAAESRFHQTRAIAGRTADKSIDMFMYEAQASHSLAELRQLRGDLEGARAAFLANYQLAQIAGPWIAGFVALSLGWLEYAADDLDAAADWFRKAHEHAGGPATWTDRRARFASDAAIRGMAGLALRRGDPAGSARLDGMAAESIEPNGGCPRLATILHKDVQRQAREILGDEAYEAAFAEGRAADRSQADALFTTTASDGS